MATPPKPQMMETAPKPLNYRIGRNLSKRSARAPAGV